MQVFSLWRTKCVLVLEYHAAQVHNVHISDLPFVAISLIWFDPGPLSFCVSRFFFVKLHSNVSNAWQASFPCSCVACDAVCCPWCPAIRPSYPWLSQSTPCPPGDTSLSFFILAVMHMSAMGKYFPWYESPYFTILPLITSDPARRSDLLTLDSRSPQAMPSGNTVSFLPAWDLRDFNWIGRWAVNSDSTQRREARLPSNTHLW